MKGIDLRSLSWDLHKVAPQHNTNPAATIENTNKKLGVFSFDELCKRYFSDPSSLHESVGELFKKDPRYWLPHKIRSSMWRWGTSRGSWNEIVDAYDCIRRFTLDPDPDVELRFDYTTGENERGFSTFSRTFIDGVFAYLVYYKGKHVMTIGFSVVAGRKILIGQVQSAKRSGNRYLYKLRGGRLDFTIERFMYCFPSYSLYLVDYADLTEKMLSEYKRGLDDAEDDIGRCNRNIKAFGDEDGDFNKSLQAYTLERDHFAKKLAHLRADKDRLISFYRNVERFELGTEVLEGRGLSHRQILSRVRE